jgi:hypothetical protein
VYAHSTLEGFFVYAPRRARPGLRLLDCWTSSFRFAPCARSDVFGGVTFEFVVPAPGGNAVYFNGEGILAFIPE